MLRNTHSGAATSTKTFFFKNQSYPTRAGYRLWFSARVLYIIILSEMKASQFSGKPHTVVLMCHQVASASW